jgi:cytochrome b6-f complex iron-sulfur subunit
MSISRRAALKLSLLASGGLTLMGIFKFLSYQQPPKRPVRVTLGEPQTYPIGSLTYVPQIEAWVIRDEAGLYALSAQCTHLGCKVAEAGSGFKCPCHGSRFGLDGAILNGPAAEPLEHIQLSLLPENVLQIDRSVKVPPGQRLSL